MFRVERSVWYAEFAKGLQAYLRGLDPEAVVDGGWPTRRSNRE